MGGAMRGLAALASSAIIAVACSSPAPAPTGSSAAAPPSPSAPPATPTPTPTPTPSAGIVVGGDRPVVVHLPSGYDRARPAPLLIVLHGYGSSGRQHEAYFGLGDLAGSRGYVTAYPDGTLDGDGNHFWNATDACCDFGGKGVDDVAYLDSVITAIAGTVSVDPKRIDLVGHSNGGFMSYALACAHAERIAAFVSLAGASYARTADCAPSRPVAMAEVHGTLDDTILFGGGTLQIGGGRSVGAYPGARASVEAWAAYDGCDPEPALVEPSMDLDADVATATSPAETTRSRWSGCDPGGAVELWTMEGGSHVPALTAAFATAALDFFDAHPKP